MGPARHDIHADARLHGRDSSRFVSPENEFALNSIEQILRTRRGMHPALERFLSIALGTLGHENQDATIAHEVAGVLERLLRLVHVDVFGKATAAGDDDIGLAWNRNHASLGNHFASSPVRRNHVAGDSSDNSALVDHYIKDEV